MPVPFPTPIFRLIHVDNLDTCLRRGGRYAPNFTPQDGLPWRPIHNVDVQAERRVRLIPCGPGGSIHDYISFYFGYLSPMTLNLKTGRVPGYDEGQEPLIYLVSTCQGVAESGVGFAFSDGHGIALYTDWYHRLEDLDKVDWDVVYARYWADKAEDMDRQRRKQAEFLVHHFVDWSLITGIGVVDSGMKGRVEEIFSRFPRNMSRDVQIRREWYYR